MRLGGGSREVRGVEGELVDGAIEWSGISMPSGSLKPVLEESVGDFGEEANFDALRLVFFAVAAFSNLSAYDSCGS